MYFNGFTLNTVSFGGLALGVGMLVDNAIVVLENIHRHREDGKGAYQASLDGSKEVAMAITASTMTTVAVFIPVLFIGGMTAQTFQQLAYVVSFALICSLIIALTVVPVLCSKLVGHREASGALGALDRWAGRIQDDMADTYGQVITWALDLKALVTLSSVALFAGTMYLIPLIGVELQPEVDEGEIRVNVELEPGTRVEVTNEVMQELWGIAVDNAPEISTSMVNAGGSSGGSGGGANRGELRLSLVPQDQRTRTAKEVANELRPMLQVHPGMLIRTRVSSGMFRRGRGGNEDGDRLAVEIRGHNIETAAQLAETIRERMSTVDGVAEAQISQRPGMPEMLVEVDRMKAANMGLNVSDIATTLETAIGGTRSSMYRKDGDEFAILVRLREQDRLNLQSVGEVPLTTATGRTIPAQSVVSLRRQEGPTFISRVDSERRLYVTGAVTDRDLGSVIGDLDVVLGEIPMPEGFSIEFGGEFEEQQEAFRDLLFAAILALVLVYMVMASQFESLRDPFLILFSVPLAAIGVVLMLLITETTFNQQAFLGIIVLVGIVVNNAIVLIDYTNLLRREHKINLRRAVLTAGTRRLRPILMTTITTVLGLGPMALGLGEGVELQAPMARVVIGGLLTSTLITLVFIPVIYTGLEERIERAREQKPPVDPFEPVAGD